MEVQASVKSAAKWQYVEMNALSSGTSGKASSSYHMAVCGEHATYI